MQNATQRDLTHPPQEQPLLTESITLVLLAAFATGTTSFRGLSGEPDLVRAALAAREIGALVDLAEDGHSNRMEGSITGAIPIFDADGATVFDSPLAGWSVEAMDAAPPLDCGNSPTTASLLLGLIAGYFVAFRLCGAEELSMRPFKNLITPLIQMGARIGRATLGCRTGCGIGADWLPFLIKGWTPLKARAVTLRQPDVLTRNALILAGTRAQGTTSITLPAPPLASPPAGDDFCNWLRLFSVDVTTDGATVTVEGPQRLLAPTELVTLGSAKPRNTKREDFL